jgi:GT2 family glycosyltransferase
MAVPAVFRNDWSSVTVPDLGAWQPSLRVSVVIPAYDCQSSVDLTLASLARQTYPQDLLEVVVVDDGSTPPLTLPPLRPANTRLIKIDTGEWGIAHACNVGVRATSGEIVLRLDADMVVFPEHVEAHARWHHRLPYAVTLGAKRFVDVRPGGPGWPTPDQVERAGVPGLFDEAGTTGHDHIEELLAATDQLRTADHLVFRAHVGATVALRREMFEAAGGFDPALRRGSDTEFGYRLLQAGAVFVPEPAARAWHLGPSSIMRDRQRILRYTRPFTADRMPHPRWLRRAGGTGWAVPLVTVVMPVGSEPLERVRAAVDSVLANHERDLRVLLVGDWAKLTDEPRRVLDDPLLDLRLIAATYRSDPRVRLVDAAPDTPFPSPYLLRLPVTTALAPWAIGRLIDEADRHQVGLVRVGLPDGERRVELWRTAALGRARWLGWPPDEAGLAACVARTHGERTLTPRSAGVVDLLPVPVDRLTAGMGAPGLSAVETAAGELRWLPTRVEVTGVRSLARAVMVVAALAGRRVATAVRRRVTRRRR